MSHRIERFSSTLKHSLADILLNDAGNPHLKLVVISDILVAPDLKKARVFITMPDGAGDSIDAVIRHLEHAKGYIKKILAQKMYLRYVPELIFIPAPTFGNIDTPDSEDNVANGDHFPPVIPDSNP